MKKYVFTIWTAKDQDKEAMYSHLVLVDNIEEAIEVAKRISNGFPFDIELDSDYNKGIYDNKGINGFKTY